MYVYVISHYNCSFGLLHFMRQFKKKSNWGVYDSVFLKSTDRFKMESSISHKSLILVYTSFTRQSDVLDKIFYNYFHLIDLHPRQSLIETFKNLSKSQSFPQHQFSIKLLLCLENSSSIHACFSKCSHLTNCQIQYHSYNTHILMIHRILIVLLEYCIWNNSQ